MSIPRHRIALFIILALIAGCAQFQSQIETSGGKVYVGMTTEQISGLLGPPDHVARGYACQYSTKFFGFVPGDHTVEWAWKRENSTIVAYLQGGQVDYLAEFPKTESKE